jgi:polyribonucleotide nucleotidyltransferase
MKIISKSVKIGDQELVLEVGRFAGQANAAVLARYGDTMVLATVVSSGSREELDYFPLHVEYVERFYAGGRIKGSRWVKREGRPSDEAILTARLIDRSIRPLFPKGYQNNVQVIVTVLSVDVENDADIPAIYATSAALAISDIPWEGPVGALRVGFVPRNGEGAFIANPTYQDREYSEIDLVVSGTDKGVIMAEGAAQVISEETMVKAIDFGQKEIQKVIQLIKEMQKEIGHKKQSYRASLPDPKLVAKIEKDVSEEIGEAIKASATKKEAGVSLGEIKEALAEKYEEEKKSMIAKAVDDLVKKRMRNQVLEKGKRADGRQADEIRPIEAQVKILPRTHGSAMFKRGNTQALTVTTLGAPSLEQFIESMEGEETKRYIHHYYMPPFSLGETGRIGWPSRRDVGHGALAERALLPVVPSEDEFPYTVRVVSEIMSSNGSTSMASVCGSTLSLMDAGVPIKAPVAGVAMGMISEGKKKVILTDILGVEDFNGNMDFKVTGTEEGITGFQLDVKDIQLTTEDFKKALAQAREARLFILKEMLRALPAARAKISKFAPKIKVIHIPVEKIGSVIGPGGKVIRQIIEETGANVDVDDDGAVNISSPEESAVDEAVAKIKGLTREVEVGEVFEEAEVKRIQPFGAFVEILPGKDGLVHVSKMSTEYVADPGDVVKVGQKVKVKVIEIDNLGRINLSMIFGQEKPGQKKSAPRRKPSRRSGQPKDEFRSRLIKRRKHSGRDFRKRR